MRVPRPITPENARVSLITDQNYPIDEFHFLL
jgi:hypothetical protein